MTLQGIKFHHFGLAVNEFSKSLTFYKNLGYDCTEPIIDSLQNVELVFCTLKNHPSVELVKPINDQSPINNYLKKNNEIIYHTCYELEHITKDVSKLFSDSRAICVSAPKPSSGLFGGRLIAFYYINNVGLVEVLQKEENATAE